MLRFIIILFIESLFFLNFQSFYFSQRISIQLWNAGCPWLFDIVWANHFISKYTQTDNSNLIENIMVIDIVGFERKAQKQWGLIMHIDSF